MKRHWFRVSVLFVTLLLTVAATDNGCEPSTAQTETISLESNQERLIRAVPPPKLITSLERKNLVRRLERINQETLVGYIQLITEDGKVVSSFTTDGKVSSLNAYLTPQEQPRYVEMSGIRQLEMMEAADHDGTYGKNPDGIFFFTLEGAYVEWNGKYIWTDRLQKGMPTHQLER